MATEDKGSDLYKDVEKLKREAQPFGHKFFTKQPFLAEVPDKGFVIAQISGSVYVYARIGDKLYKTTALTVV